MNPRASLPSVTTVALASGADGRCPPAQAHQRQRSTIVTLKSSQAGWSAATSKEQGDFDSADVEILPWPRQENPFEPLRLERSAQARLLDALLAGLLLVGIILCGLAWIAWVS